MNAPVDADSPPQYGHIALQPRQSEYVPNRLLGHIDFTVFADGEVKRGVASATARELASEIAAHLKSQCVGMADGAYVSVTSPREAVETAVEYVAQAYEPLYSEAQIDSEDVVSVFFQGTSYRDWPTRRPSMTTVRGRYRVAISVAAVLFDAFRTHVGIAETRQSATVQPPQHR